MASLDPVRHKAGFLATGGLLVASGTCGFLVARYGLDGAGIAIAGAGVVLGILRPREGALLALVLGLVQFGPTRTFPVLPQIFTLADDALIVGLALRWLSDSLLRRTVTNPWVSGGLGAWAVATGVSALVARTTPATVLLALRGIGLPMLLYPVVATYVSHAASRRWVVRIILWNAVGQAVLALFQWAANRGNIDAAYGLLGPGGANALGFVLLSGVVFIAAEERLTAARWVEAIGITIGIVAASARAAMFGIPVAVAIAVRRRLARLRVVTLVIVVVGAALLAVGYYYQNSTRSIAYDLSPSSILEAQTVPTQGGRLIYAFALPGVLSRQPFGWALGVGPGGFTSYVGVNDRSPAYLDVAPFNSASSTGRASPDNEWVAVLGEYGLLGLTILLLMLFRPAWLAFSMRRVGGTGLIEDADLLVNVLPAALFLVLYGGMSINYLEYQPLAYVWWATAGLMESLAAEVRLSGVPALAPEAVRPTAAGGGAPEWKA